MENKQQLLVKRPVGVPDEDTWNFTSTPIRDLEDGEMLVEQHYISLDPAMRGWMNETRSYIPPVQLGEVMRAGTVGKVIKTQGRTPFNEGDYITGWGECRHTSLRVENNIIRLILIVRLFPLTLERWVCQA